MDLVPSKSPSAQRLIGRRQCIADFALEFRPSTDLRKSEAFRFPWNSPTRESKLHLHRRHSYRIPRVTAQKNLPDILATAPVGRCRRIVGSWSQTDAHGRFALASSTPRKNTSVFNDEMGYPPIQAGKQPAWTG
jgi:hypothetical protein